MEASLMYDWVPDVELAACQCRCFPDLRFAIINISYSDITDEFVQYMPLATALATRSA